MNVVQIKNEDFPNYSDLEKEFYENNILKFETFDISIMEFFLDAPYTSKVAFGSIYLLVNDDAIFLFEMDTTKNSKIIPELSLLKIAPDDEIYRGKLLFILNPFSEKFINLVKKYCEELGINYRAGVFPASFAYSEDYKNFLRKNSIEEDDGEYPVFMRNNNIKIPSIDIYKFISQYTVRDIFDMLSLLPIYDDDEKVEIKFYFPEKEASKKNLNRINKFFNYYDKLTVGNCTLSIDESGSKTAYVKNSKETDIEVKDLLNSICSKVYYDEDEILPSIKYIYHEKGFYGGSYVDAYLIKVRKATPGYIKYCRALAKNIRHLVGDYGKYYNKYGYRASVFPYENSYKSKRDITKSNTPSTVPIDLMPLYKTAYLVSITGFSPEIIPFKKTDNIQTTKSKYFTPKGKYYYYKFTLDTDGNVCPYQPNPSDYFPNVVIYAEEIYYWDRYMTHYSFNITDDDLFIPVKSYSQEIIDDFLDTQWLEHRLMFENIKS